MGLVAIPNIAALRQQPPTLNEAIFVMGTSAPNDGGAGMYIFIANSPAVDNGTTIIRSENGTGCWFLNLANSPSGSPQYDGSYVLASADPYLPNSRVLTAGSNITITDNGPGGTIVISGSAGGVSTASLPLIITASDIALGTAQGPTTPDATSSVTWSPSGAASTGLVLQSIAAQSVPIMEVQTSTGAVCFSLPVPTGTLTGANNNLIGINAGDGLTSGAQNTLIGTDAGGAAASGAMSDTVMIGYRAGLLNTANQNVFIGSNAGDANTSGIGHVIVGYNAGTNTTGNFNSIFGYQAGDGITSGASNTIIGRNAGGSGSAGAMSETVIIGAEAGLVNTGDQNVFVGAIAGFSNTSGLGQSFFGYRAGVLATGSNNSIFGHNTGDGLTTGERNCLFGKDAGGAAGATAMSDSAFFGYQAGLLVTGNNNTLLGSSAGDTITTGNACVIIGTSADASATVAGGIAIGFGTTVTSNASIVFGANATNTAANQFVVGSSTSPITDAYIGSGVTNSSAAASTINGTGGSGSDNAGANLQLAGGKGTGIANPGLVVLKYPLRTTTGSTLQSLSTQSFPVSTTSFTGNISDVTVDANVVNTTQTTMIGTVVGSQSIEGGLLRAGRVIRVSMAGILTTSAAPVSYVIRVNFAGTAIAQTAAVTPTASNTAQAWTCTFNILVRTIGATGTTICNGLAFYRDVTLGTPQILNMVNTAATIDTTATSTIDATITFGGNTAGNTITMKTITCEILN